MTQLSKEALQAQLAGAMAMCPGCKIERKLPENRYGAALHQMPNGSNYECHAGDEAWEDVPEFKAQPNDRSE